MGGLLSVPSSEVTPLDEDAFSHSTPSLKLTHLSMNPVSSRESLRGVLMNEEKEGTHEGSDDPLDSWSEKTSRQDLDELKMNDEDDELEDEEEEVSLDEKSRSSHQEPLLPLFHPPDQPRRVERPPSLAIPKRQVTQGKSPVKSPTKSLGTSKGAAFERLPNELALYLLSSHLDFASLCTLSQTSRYWHSLCRDDHLYRLLYESRFRLHPSRTPLILAGALTPTPYREAYITLDAGLSSWTGLALDPITNNKNPYAMELIVKYSVKSLRLGKPLLSLAKAGPTFRGPGDPVSLLSSPPLSSSSSPKSPDSAAYEYFRVNSFEGACRWPDLDDALTRMSGSVCDSLSKPYSRFTMDSFLGVPVSRVTQFTESAILRGADLAIPNRYQGLIVGSLMLGFYDPGHLSLMGSFGLVLEESLPLSPILERSQESMCRLLKCLTAPSRGLFVWSSLYKGAHDTACYLEMTPPSLTNNDSSSQVLETQITFFTSTPVHTSLDPHPLRACNPLVETVSMSLILEINPSSPEEKGKSSAATPSLRGHFRRPTDYILLKEQSQWIEDHLPLHRDLHLSLSDNVLFGLFLSPRPGVFFVKLSSS